MKLDAKVWRDGKLVEHTIDGVLQSARSITVSWPVALLPLKLMAKKGDQGAGDIIARVIGPIGGSAFKAWYKLIFGKDCGCGERQDLLNARWPL